jgi:cytochrome c
MKQMKLLFIPLGLVAIIALNSFTKENVKDNYIEPTAILQNTPAEKLMAKSDCMVCHNKEKKVIGPSFVDIANKYPANTKNINYLADKIIKGGAGVWGTIPMAAHVGYNKEDAKTIVKYILSLKK